MPWVGDVNVLAVVEVARFGRPQSTSKQEQHFPQSRH
jgi:hypothetical protein